MDSNTHSTTQSTRLAGGRPDHLASLAAVVDGLAVQDLDGLTDAALAEQVLGLRRLVDRLRVTGSGSWRPSTAGVLPGLTKTSRLARPPPGSGTACAWVPALQPAVSGPPGPCSGVRWAERPAP